VVGDGGMTIAQPEGGTPCLYEIEQSGEEYEVSIITHVNPDFGIGSMSRPNVVGGVSYYLNSGHLDTFQMTKDELGTFLFTTMPIRFDGQLFWNDEVPLDELLS
jgi:hypothetical protein